MHKSIMGSHVDMHQVHVCMYVANSSCLYKEAALWNACKDGELAQVKVMMLQGAEVRWRNPACNVRRTQL